MQAKTRNTVKRVVDAVLTVLLLFIMAYQVTGDELHEWLGIGMTAVLIIHNILNRRWYASLFKGKYPPYRRTVTIVNMLLLISITVTALTGMSMSGHAVPFMYDFIDVDISRRLHLSLSWWSFILMGIHIGLHLRAMTAKLAAKARSIFNVSLAAAACAGLCLFLKNEILKYLFFSQYAFLDYSKPQWLVVTENLAMLLFWAFAGHVLSYLVQFPKHDD